MYVAMHFAAAAQVLLGLKCSRRLSSVSFKLFLAGSNRLDFPKEQAKG